MHIIYSYNSFVNIQSVIFQCFNFFQKKAPIATKSKNSYV